MFPSVLYPALVKDFPAFLTTLADFKTPPPADLAALSHTFLKPPPLVGFVVVPNTLLPAPPERPLINLPPPLNIDKAALPSPNAITAFSINPSSLLLSPTCSTMFLAFTPHPRLSIIAAFVFSYCFLVPCITSSHPRSVVAISLISSLSDWVCCFIISKSVLDNDFSARLTSCFLPLLSTYETVALPFCTVAIFLSNSCSSSV